jgi:hypothetical protein
MSAITVHDPDALSKSEMGKLSRLCNGLATGRQCEHYYMHVKVLDSLTAHLLRQGQIFRVCMALGPQHGEMSFHEMPHTCTAYRPRKKRFLAVLGLVEDKGRYRGDIEEYRPLEPSKGVELKGTPLPVDNTPASVDDAFADTSGTALDEGTGNVDNVIAANLEAFVAEADEYLKNRKEQA